MPSVIASSIAITIATKAKLTILSALYSSVWILCKIIYFSLSSNRSQISVSVLANSTSIFCSLSSRSMTLLVSLLIVPKSFSIASAYWICSSFCICCSRGGGADVAVVGVSSCCSSRVLAIVVVLAVVVAFNGERPVLLSLVLL